MCPAWRENSYCGRMPEEDNCTTNWLGGPNMLLTEQCSKAITYTRRNNNGVYLVSQLPFKTVWKVGRGVGLCKRHVTAQTIGFEDCRRTLWLYGD